MKNLICALIATSLFACNADDPTPTAPTEPAAADAQQAPEATNAALATLVKGGDFHFALEDSEVLQMFEDKCAGEKDPEACLDEIRRTSEGEGVAITPIEGNRIHYLSYVTENGERKPHIEAKMTVAPTDEPGIVELVDGETIVGPELPPNAHVLIEVVDDDTIAMDKALGHPRTGGKRLVFHRAAR